MAIYKELVRKVSIPADKKTKQKDYLEKGALPIIDQGQSLIGGYSHDLSKVIPCELPVIVFGDHTKCVKFVNFPFGAGADGIKVLQPKDGISPKYLFYGTQYLTYRVVNKGYARHYQYIEKMSLNVPSETEQEQIVSHIEELFSELDKSVETLQTTKKQLAVYRQAVLKTIFEELAKVEYCPITELCENIVDCPHSTPKWVKNGILCLRTSNFKRGYLDLTEKNYVSIDTYQQRTTRLVPKPGDVLFSREGAILGIACIIPDNLQICMGQRMMLLRTAKELNNKYLMYYLNSPQARKLVVKNIGGSASPHINVGDIKKFGIPKLPLERQKSIVSEIESRLSVCDSIEKNVDTALAQAEAMRQSILKEAFEGEL